jgi:hypothetical protein
LQAAHRHRLAFAEDAGDLDAGDALQRFGNVGVGKLADILRMPVTTIASSSAGAAASCA